jgi:hypothetical protein
MDRHNDLLRHFKSYFWRFAENPVNGLSNAHSLRSQANSRLAERRRVSGVLKSCRRRCALSVSRAPDRLVTVTLAHPELLQLFDQQVRRNSALDGSGSVVSVGPTYLRWAASNGVGWSEVMWTSLSEETADNAIAEHLEFYASRDLRFIWSVYEYDQPSDLGSRLQRAGFSLSSTSAVMIADATRIVGEPVLPPGAALHHIRDEAGVNLLIAVHESVFGHSQEDLRRSLVHRLEVAPNEMDMFVVMTEAGEPVSSSRVEYLPDGDFAALWGGSTEPDWRGQGLYRAQTVYRALLARERGYRYLMVLASTDSQPILRAMGFDEVTRVTRYAYPD